MKYFGAVFEYAGAVVDVWAVDDLPFPLRPIVDFHPCVEFLRIWSVNGIPLAASEPITVAVSVEATDSERPIFQFEVNQAGGQILENPRQIDFDLRIVSPQ